MTSSQSVRFLKPLLVLLFGLAGRTVKADAALPTVAAHQHQLAAAPADTTRVLLLNSLCWQSGLQNMVQALGYG